MVAHVVGAYAAFGCNCCFERGVGDEGNDVLDGD